MRAASSRRCAWTSNAAIPNARAAPLHPSVRSPRETSNSGRSAAQRPFEGEGEEAERYRPLRQAPDADGEQQRHCCDYGARGPEEGVHRRVCRIGFRCSGSPTPAAVMMYGLAPSNSRAVRPPFSPSRILHRATRPFSRPCDAAQAGRPRRRRARPRRLERGRRRPRLGVRARDARRPVRQRPLSRSVRIAMARTPCGRCCGTGRTRRCRICSTRWTTMSRPRATTRRKSRVRCGAPGSVRRSLSPPGTLPRCGTTGAPPRRSRALPTRPSRTPWTICCARRGAGANSRSATRTPRGRAPGSSCWRWANSAAGSSTIRAMSI